MCYDKPIAFFIIKNLGFVAFVTVFATMRKLWIEKRGLSYSTSPHALLYCKNERMRTLLLYCISF
jgi:hypothetical protein